MRWSSFMRSDVDYCHWGRLDRYASRSSCDEDKVKLTVNAVLGYKLTIRFDVESLQQMNRTTRWRTKERVPVASIQWSWFCWADNWKRCCTVDAVQNKQLYFFSGFNCNFRSFEFFPPEWLAGEKSYRVWKWVSPPSETEFHTLWNWVSHLMKLKLNILSTYSC